ncbi:MAG: hypothetical protein HYT21_02780 [Candidatus Nealsonbacteria bacterium]|nr:hypothetical protein [Candidatus Nealsonbacteria bacterium]
MRRIFLLLFFIFLPTIATASVAEDFKVNPQSTYDIPYNTSRVLVLDLTLSAPKQSIILSNAGTADHTVISELTFWQDGSSADWNGDETEVARVLSPPFFDTAISGNFSGRIFVTADIKNIASLQARTPEAISSTTLRWHFQDQSNNEFGFKILDGNLRVVARTEQANVSYIDETGLQPDTEYSGRLAVAFNDRGTSLTTVLSNFEAVRTLAAPEEVQPPAEVEGEGEEVVDLRDKIETLQLQLLDLLNQLIQVLQEQIAASQASIFSAFSIFTFWLESFF